MGARYGYSPSLDYLRVCKMSRAQILTARLIIGVYLDRARVMKRLGRTSDTANLVAAARQLHRLLMMHI